MGRTFMVFIGLFVTVLLFGPAGAETSNKAGVRIGPSGLELPRFASLKADRVNVRQGPGRDHAIKWVFKKAGLPVEILNEYDNWRQVRASDGTEGWVYKRLLSARRTALIMPWEKNPVIVTLHAGPSPSKRVIAKLESGVLANILSCDGTWCHVTVADYKGWVRQDRLWGVYLNEKIK